MKKFLLSVFVSVFAMQAQASTQELINGVKNNDVPKVLELLNNGEDVNGADKSGTTALHYAVAYDNAEITQILLSYGADLIKANAKGWTPLKIAEQKDLKKVTPVLVQYLQLQKQQAKEPALANKRAAEPEKVVKPAAEPKVAEQKAVQKAPIVYEAAVEVEQVKSVKETPKEALKNAPKEAPVITAGEYQNVINEAKKQILAARQAQAQAENNANALYNEIVKIKTENEVLVKALAEKMSKDEEKTKAPQKEEKAEALKSAKAESKPAKEIKTAKPSPKPVKPILKKKPVYKAPQPIVEKVVLKPSAMAEGIYAGDEEIVYCLDYLGNGDDEQMKRAAGHFAAMASIGEARYKQIIDKANAFFLAAEDKEMNKRTDECSKIIFPADKNKQNQIIRSMNKSAGY